MTFHYGQGRPPLALTRNGQRFSLHFDQVGTLRAVARESGRRIQTSTYDSFGNPLEVLHPEVRIPLGFAGGLLDSDTGLTRFGLLSPPGPSPWRDAAVLDSMAGN